jgi:hypothetical protein
VLRTETHYLDEVLDAQRFTHQIDVGSFDNAIISQYDTLAPSRAPTGQVHHPISKPVFKALEEHPNLAGQYQPRDPRFTTQAIDDAAHRGYQTWHRELDAEAGQWIRNNPQATPQTFEGWLNGRYNQTDLQQRFPNGL